MKRIAIIGIGGSGKSTVSRKVAEMTGLPLFHMDQLFWKGNWEAVPEKEYLVEHEKLVALDEWIIEGYIDEKMKSRTERADLILYLDYPGWFCMWRVFKRWVMHHREARPELPKEALERFNPNNLWLAFTRGERKDMEVSLKNVDQSKVSRVYYPDKLKKYLSEKLDII